MSKGMNMFVGLGIVSKQDINKGHRILSYDTVHCPKAKEEFTTSEGSYSGVVKASQTSNGLVCSHCDKMVY